MGDGTFDAQFMRRFNWLVTRFFVRHNTTKGIKILCNFKPLRLVFYWQLKSIRKVRPARLNSCAIKRIAA